MTYSDIPIFRVPKNLYVFNERCLYLFATVLIFLSRNKRLYRINYGNKAHNLIESLNRKVNKVNVKGHYQANDFVTLLLYPVPSIFFQYFQMYPVV